MKVRIEAGRESPAQRTPWPSDADPARKAGRLIEEEPLTFGGSIRYPAFSRKEVISDKPEPMFARAGLSPLQHWPKNQSRYRRLAPSSQNALLEWSREAQALRPWKRVTRRATSEGSNLRTSGASSGARRSGLAGARRKLFGLAWPAWCSFLLSEKA